MRAWFWCGKLMTTLLKPRGRLKDNIKVDLKNRMAGRGLD